MLSKVYKVLHKKEHGLYSAMGFADMFPVKYRIKYELNSEKPNLPIGNSVIYVFEQFKFAEKFLINNTSTFLSTRKLVIFECMGIDVEPVNDRTNPVEFVDIDLKWKRNSGWCLSNKNVFTCKGLFLIKEVSHE